jgi:MEMO1 family protein
MTSLDCRANQPSGSVRPAAVAGQFYPGNAATLRKDVERYLADAAGRTKLPSAPRMLISPHAGYVFSGPVAGYGYSTIDKSVKTVILIGPSHHAMFDGLALPGVDSFETPLGRLPLNKEVIAKLSASPLVGVVPKAHSAEHCLEVQLPFLQVLVPGVSIVPLVTGQVDPAAVAELLAPLIDDKTLVIASSDLSHYSASREARRLDSVTIGTVLKGDVGGPLDACGETAIRVVMRLARQFGLEPVVLDARNSYETTADAAPQYADPNRVVGYASIAFVKKGGAATPKPVQAQASSVASASGAPAGDGLAPATKSYLLALARAALEAAVKGERPPATGDAPAETKEKRGCFVTLTESGQLRGCIGYIEPIKPLADALVDNARSAALSDPRFPQVVASELKDITVEVSVLTKPEALAFAGPDDLLRKLVPGRDGVILSKGFHQSTFLPQVWDQLPDKVQFLEHLSLKGGMSSDGWKDAQVKTYRAVHFQEEK